MGTAGFVLGGLLQGVGTGIAQDIAAKREVALENLRATYKAASDERTATREEAKDERATDRALKLEAVKGGVAIQTKKMEVQSAADIQAMRNSGDVSVERIRQASTTARDLAVQSLRNSGSQQDIQLSKELERQDVDTSYTNAQGRLVVVFKNGRAVTTMTKGEAPKANEGGGDLNSLRGGGVLNRAPYATAATPPPAQAAARPAAAATEPAETAAVQSLPADEVAKLYQKATQLASQGDPRFKGKSASQIRQIVDDGLANKGYTVGR